MVSKTLACRSDSLDAEIVNIEAKISKGFTNFTIVGLAGTSIMEARERIRSAMLSSGVKLSAGKIVVNLYPGDERKEGTQWDLPISVALCHAMGKIPIDSINNAAFIGELGLDGTVRYVPACIRMALKLKDYVNKIYIPYDSIGACSCIKGVKIYPVKSLKEVLDDLRGIKKIEAITYNSIDFNKDDEDDDYPDFIRIKGQSMLKRAMLIGGLGRHSMLLIGPPGVGKSMAIRAVRGIMPDLSQEDLIEVAGIRSIYYSKDKNIFSKKIPFRMPHYSISRASLIGGGKKVRPGEVSFAHKGILFLDELSFFSSQCLEALRMPMDTKTVSLTRNNKSNILPADFQLLAAMNPCPCGHRGDPLKACNCSSSEILRYINRISQPLLDRFDMVIRVSSIDWENAPDDGIDTKKLKDELNEALKFRDSPLLKDGADKKSQAEYLKSKLDNEGAKLMEDLSVKYSLSARFINSLLSLGETIRLLNRDKNISQGDLAEAMQLKKAALTLREL